MHLSIIRTREARTAGVIMQSFPGDPKAKTAQRGTNRNSKEVQESEGNFPRRGEPLTLIHEQPKDSTEAVGKPTGKQRGNQTEQITEHRNGGGNNPRHNPQREGNTNPRSGGDPVALVQTVCTLENTQVYIFERDMAVDHTGDDDSR